MLRDFRDFIMHGNVLDMAVGIIIGIAFSAIVTSLVRDLIMPPFGLLLGNVDFTNLFFILKSGEPSASYTSLVDAQAAGAVSINYGVFINTIISFLIIAIAVFLIIRAFVKARQKFEKQTEATPAAPTKECPYCLSKIPIAAKKCAYCTSQLPT